jgi:predicted ribosome quality control (RQC) complex YloA/Tae2 family protein
MRARARALGVRAPENAAAEQKRARPAQRSPYRRFAAITGHVVLVGRSATDNDTVTHKIARPWDLWLHCRGQTGAHVILMMRKGEQCPPEALLDAATLAVHFSEARDEAVADVQHTNRRNVRGVKGAIPGRVIVTQEKVIALRMQRERLSRLLATERENDGEGYC